MDHADTVASLERMAGSWVGGGAGEFPTIRPFTYRERMDIVAERRGLLQYRQRTWKIVDDVEMDSHIETGFIGVVDDGSIEVTSAQGLDRVEVLVGALVPSTDGFVLDVRSVDISHDRRMVGSWRTVTLENEVLSYRMGMATTAVPGGSLHLSATLTRAE